MCVIGDFVFGLMTCEPCFMFINYTLTPFLDNALWLVTKVRTRSHSGHSYACFDLHIMHANSRYPLISLPIVMIASFY